MPAEQRVPAITTGAGPARGAGTARKGCSPREKVRSLQRSLYRAAKADRRRTFHQLYQHVWREEILWEAWRQVRDNGGAGGVDGVELNAFASQVEIELRKLSEELRSRSYRPRAIRRVEIPKSKTESRPIGIATVRDRVVQTAVKIVLEPVLEARFYENSYGFRPRRSAHQALDWIGKLLQSGYRYVLDVDIRQFFDQVPHGQLLGSLGRQVTDRRLLHLIKQILKAPVQESTGELRKNRRGCPQGGPLSPLLSNLYLSILDYWFVKNVWFKDGVWLRYADDGVFLSRQPLGNMQWRVAGVLHRMGLKLHEGKTREVDMGAEGATLDYLGYRFARRKSRSTAGLALLQYPTPKACRRIRETLRALVPRRGNRLPAVLVWEVNRVVEGWVRYFARSNRKQPFKALGDFVKQRVRMYLTRRRGLRGRGTRAYPDAWLRDVLGLTSVYHFYTGLRFPQPNAVGGR
jgi:group II intron reverse transcriptase/maturase